MTLPHSTTHCEPLSVDVAVVGGGPAGLMAAQVLGEAGVAVHVFDAMPSVGRKFLLAGKGGLNLTHSEALDVFSGRYGSRRDVMEPLLSDFTPQTLRDWARTLGVETFVGSSGRVFPSDMKAAPLLRAWLHRLRNPSSGVGVRFHMRHRWKGWTGVEAEPLPAQRGCQHLEFDTPEGHLSVIARAVVFALGGGSWARLGSNGAWIPLFSGRGVTVAPLRPSNCGFDVQGGWTPLFREKFAGHPFKSVAISFSDALGGTFARKGEFVATTTGVEGSLIYAASSLVREEITRNGSATICIDLLPDMSAAKVLSELQHPRGSRSLANHLKSRLHLEGIKSAILYECVGKEAMHDPIRLAAAIKALPIILQSPRPLDEAISSAGGVEWSELTSQLMLTRIPGVFCAGEMLDWEAPTGGYLLQACFATGYAAGRGAAAYLQG
jgi:uncharacterized flavoprotein (TIGR03862 family)